MYIYMNFGSNRPILSELASGIHFYNGHLYQHSPNTNTYKNHVGCLMWDENLIHSLWCSCVACNDVLYLTFHYENRFYSESWCPETRDIFSNVVFIFNRKNNLKSIIRVKLFRRAWLCIKSMASLFNDVSRCYNQSCVLLALCEGNHRSPVNSYHKRPVPRSCDVLFDVHPNNLSVTMDSHHKGTVMGGFGRSIWPSCWTNLQCIDTPSRSSNLTIFYMIYSWLMYAQAVISCCVRYPDIELI